MQSHKLHFIHNAFQQELGAPEILILYIPKNKQVMGKYSNTSLSSSHLRACKKGLSIPYTPGGIPKSCTFCMTCQTLFTFDIICFWSKYPEHAKAKTSSTKGTGFWSSARCISQVQWMHIRLFMLVVSGLVSGVPSPSRSRPRGWGLTLNGILKPKQNI